MKLLLRFDLFSIVLVAIGLAVVSWVARSFLMENARNQVLQEAKLMMESASSTRNAIRDQVPHSEHLAHSTIA